MIATEEQRATLLVLYPLFKEEVYRRRHEMIRWTAIGAGSLVAILIVLLLVPTQSRLTFGSRALLATAILLFAATFASLILQQQRRHRQAKQTLIELEQSLGLFDDNTFTSHRPLYPDRWQSDWKQDRSTTLSLVLLGLLALLALIAIVFIA